MKWYNPQVDEQSMMTYLSQYPNARLKAGAPVKPVNKSHLVRCYGSGLEPTGHIVDKPVQFHIENSSSWSWTSRCCCRQSTWTN